MYQITLVDIAVAFIPVLATVMIIGYWSHSIKSASVAISRMLIQLLLIGYALNFIFDANSQWIILLVLIFMLVAASWIGLNALPVDSMPLFKYSFSAIACGGGIILIFISQGVLHVDPWYQPQVMIPIAGMIFSNSMNAVSLAGERLYSELDHDNDFSRARNIAFQAAMIPVINALLAVGLVSLPWYDDRANTGWHCADNCCTLSDYRHVHDIQFCRNFGCAVFILAKISIPESGLMNKW